MSKVSVIIVAHPKYKQYLKQTLQSLSGAADHELIVVNNGCSNEITRLVGDTAKEQRFSGNLAAASNAGIQAASGDYIIRLDADDWIAPELIEYEQSHLERHHLDCVWCDYWKTYEQKGEGYSVHYLEPAPQETLEHACGAMFRRTVWEELGGYDESLNYQEAFDFWTRLKQGGYRFKRLALPLYFYRQHQGSMSTNPERDKVRAKLEARYGLR